MQENIVIVVRADGTRVVTREFENIGKATSTATRLLGAFAAALSVNQVRKWADTWTSARGKVNIFTKTIEETNYTMQQLMRTAQDTRQPLDATVNSFHQMTLAASTLGASQKELMGATSLVNKVFAIQGTTAMTARGGLIQFGQAMTEGIVRAQEYNSMINAMPLLLKVVAENMDGTGGSVARLRQMMLDGELTSKKFFEAMMKGQGQINELFERSGKTIGQAFTLLDNAATQYVGKLDESLGISQKLFAMAKWGAENFDLLANSLLAIASPLVITGLLKVVAGVRALTAAAMLNPFVAIAAAIMAAVTAVTLFRHDIMILKDEQVSLGDYMSATWELAQTQITKAADLLKGEYADASSIAEKAMALLGDMGTKVAAKIRGDINGIVGMFVALGKTIGIVAAGIWPALKDGVRQAANGTIKMFEDVINTTIKATNILRDKVGLATYDLIKIQPLDNEDKGALNNMVTEIQGAWKEAFNTDYVGEAFTFAKGKFDELSVVAREHAAARKKEALEAAELQRQLDLAAAAGAGGGEDYTKGGKGKKGKKGMFDDPRTLENSLRRLLNQIQPMAGAVLEYEKAQKILNAAVDKGLISQEDQVKYLELVKNHYRDIVDPIGAVTREMEREAELLKMSADAREVSNTMFQIEEKLRKDGIMLLKEESDAIRDQVEAMQELTRVSAAQDQMRANSQGQQRKGFGEQVKGLNGLKDDPSFSSGDQAGAAAGMLEGMGVDTANTGVGWEAQLAQYETYYANLAEMRDNDLIGEQDYWAAKAQLFTSQYQGQLDTASNFFGSLSALQSSENKKAARIGKAAAIAQAMIDTYSSATKAFNSMAGIPYVGPVLGAAAAAAAVAAGMANVNRIRSQPVGFLTGGDFKVGGSGGQDSKLVQFRATPGETVSVATPTQVRKGNPVQDNESKRGKPTTVIVQQTYNVQGAIDNRTRSQMAADSARDQRRQSTRLGG